MSVSLCSFVEGWTVYFWGFRQTRSDIGWLNRIIKYSNGCCTNAYALILMIRLNFGGNLGCDTCSR